MKYNLTVINDNENLQLKKPYITQREYGTELRGALCACALQKIPTEVIHKIVLYCSVIEKHTLRFVCKQLHQISHKCGSIQNGNFFFVDSTQTKNTRCTSIFSIAAQEGYLNILKWTNQYFSTIFAFHKRFCCGSATKGRHLEILKWARENGCPWDKGICASAAKKGHFEILKWARENGCPWDAGTCSGAARGGHLEILKWARENRCRWHSETCSGAARGGHLEILKWARENRCEWDQFTCASAAQGGHLEILKWVKENNCPWDERTCYGAAANGHLDVLKWAVENGCPWHPDSCKNLAEGGGHLDIVEWINKNQYNQNNIINF
jgi:hypothetical protein